jgi:hypothetical protein
MPKCGRDEMREPAISCAISAGRHDVDESPELNYRFIAQTIAYLGSSDLARTNIPLPKVTRLFRRWIGKYRFTEALLPKV